MPRFKITETFTNDVKSNTYINASNEASALGIATALYGGNHQVFEESATIITEEASLTAVGYKRASIMLKNEATDNTTFLTLLIEATKDISDIVLALKGKTVNGVVADIVTITSMSETEV